jgi:hypothetical protein
MFIERFRGYYHHHPHGAPLIGLLIVLVVILIVVDGCPGPTGEGLSLAFLGPVGHGCDWPRRYGRWACSLAQVG